MILHVLSILPEVALHVRQCACMISRLTMPGMGSCSWLLLQLASMVRLQNPCAEPEILQGNGTSQLCALYHTLVTPQ